MLKAAEHPSVPSSPSLRADLPGIGLALLSAATSGTLGLWGKLATASHLSTPTLLSWRFGLTALLLAALGQGRVPPRERARLLLLGAVYAGSTVAYFASLARISAGTAALLVYVAPAFVVLYGALTGTRPSRAQLGALLCSVLGLGVVVGVPGAADRDLPGLGLGALSGGLYGAYLFLSGRLAAGSAPLAVTTHVTLVSALTFAAIGTLGGTLAVPQELGHWGLILGMLIVPTLISMPALFSAVQRLGAARASLLTTTDPLWALLFAALLLGEPLGPSQIAGGALILGGAVLAQSRRSTQRLSAL
ncbi:DMT family transporter [uncultured Deinococcus sp.]|uniref:DMT family transporter n=1 Tax=uncultured Deinococcus sp. TaxID=158789 RepID=UPI00258558CF|nr:DMT family transporter [uncultured Deinococcus sp.]